MNVYCSKDCEMTGAVCDFCKNYIDYGTDGEFAGTGICNALQIEVDAFGSCSNHFVCMNVPSSQTKLLSKRDESMEDLTLERILTEADRLGIKYEYNPSNTGGFFVTKDDGSKEKISLKDILLL